MQKTLSKLSLLVPLLCTSLVHAADLNVEIADVKSTEGLLVVAVFNSADTYLKQAVTGVRTQAVQPGKTVVVKDLPAGDYAVLVYHDTNQNGKLDRNIMGIPTEDYAFSNNAPVKFGPPAFDAAKLTLPEAGLSIRISLR